MSEISEVIKIWQGYIDEHYNQYFAIIPNIDWLEYDVENNVFVIDKKGLNSESIKEIKHLIEIGGKVRIKDENS